MVILPGCRNDRVFNHRNWRLSRREERPVSCFIATPLPGLAPTRTYPNPGGIFPELPLGGNYNQLTYFLNGQLTQAFTGQYINHWRREKLKPAGNLTWQKSLWPIAR